VTYPTIRRIPLYTYLRVNKRDWGRVAHVEATRHTVGATKWPYVYSYSGRIQDRAGRWWTFTAPHWTISNTAYRHWRGMGRVTISRIVLGDARLTYEGLPR
jgi:hypothetical protein